MILSNINSIIFTFIIKRDLKHHSSGSALMLLDAVVYKSTDAFVLVY